MFTNIHQKVARLLSVAMLVLVPVAVPAVASAAVNNAITDNLCQGANLTVSSGGDCSNTQEGTDTINSIITTVINVFSIVVGVVSVIMIIFGGFKYITSNGDSNNVSAAKNTIIYAIIGLIIVALSQFVVKFVLNKLTTA